MVVNHLAWIILNPTRKRGTSTKSLAYASGYEEQSAFELSFTMSIAALLYNENSIDHE